MPPRRAFGLIGLVLALALQKVVENFVGGLILQARRPYTVGHTVDLDGHVGVVVDIDSRTTVLRRLDGSQVRVPNGDVLSSAIVDLTREGLRRSELTVGVAYDSDLERATDVLSDAVGRVPRIAKNPAPWVMLRQFGASSRRPPERVFTERAAAPPAPAVREDEGDGSRWRLPWRR